MAEHPKAAPGESHPTTLPRVLGLWDIVAIVVGGVIGSGIFLLPSSLAPYGGISIAGWALTTAGALCLALVFARLASLVPKAGGPYAYTRAGFGDFAGFWVAWGYWIATWAGNAAIAVAMVSYLRIFVPGLERSTFLGCAAAAAAVWALTWVNCRGIRAAGWVQVATTVLKLVPLASIAFFGIFWMEPGHFIPFNRSGDSAFSAVSAAAALTLWSFLGLEAATIPADAVDRPARTIPRATVAGTLIVAAVYVLGTVAVMGALPPDLLAKSGAPFADAARALWGDWAYYFVGFGAVFLSTRLLRDLRGPVVGAVLGAFTATLSGAVLTSLWLALSGLYPLRGILSLMLVTHTAIGVLEAALTGAIVVTLLRWRPDLVAGPGGAAGLRRPAAVAVGVLGVALVVAAFLAPFASPLPDGLERTALDLGFSARANPILPAPLEKSALFSGPLAPWAPILAGLIGTLLVALVAWRAARGLSKASDVPHR